MPIEFRRSFTAKCCIKITVILFSLKAPYLIDAISIMESPISELMTTNINHPAYR